MSVDERIVRLDMENQGFERGAEESIKTLSALKSALDLGGAGKSLLNLQSIGDKFSLSSMASVIDTISDRFTLLGAIGFNAMDRIANKAVDAGERMIKSLSVDNITAGWSKYGQKTTSVATLISQGYDMDVVEDQLARLNWFTDETSYNFVDMVSNISKFTASGQDLEKSVTAMEGIANWASLSGQNASVASRAMYQLSQAMSSGAMRKQDYMSIQNANMDTQEFRQKALDAAVALGTLKKNSDDTYQSLVANTEAFTIGQFADHLTQDAWFTSDVMMKVFNDYSAAVDQIYEYAEKKGITASQAIEELGDSVDAFGLKAFRSAQEAKTFEDVIDSVKDAVSTSWMQIFDELFGNYEQSKVMWTDLANTLYDIFAAPLASKVDMLAMWNELGGRDDILDGIHNIWHAVEGLFGAASEGFDRIFPKAEEYEDQISNAANAFKSFTESFKGLTERIHISDTAMENIRRTFAGVAAVVDIVRMGIVAFVKAVGTIIGKVMPAGEGILSITGRIGDFAVSMRDAIKEGNFFGAFFEKLTNIFGYAYDGIAKVVNAIKEFVNLNFSKFVKEGEEVEKSFSIFKTIGNIASAAIQRLSPIFSGIATVIGDFFRMMGQALGEFDPQKLLTLINAGVLTKVLNSSNGVLGTVQGFIGSLKSTVSDLGGIKSKIFGVFDGLKESLSAFTESIKADTLIKIATAIGILTISLIALSTIETEKLMNSLTAIGALFLELMATLKVFSSSFDKSGSANLKKISTALITFSASMVILSLAVKNLASLDWDELARGIAGVGASAAIMVVAAKALSANAKKLAVGGTSLMLFSTAILILAQSVKQLSALKPQELLQGLAGVAALFAEIALFVTAMQGSKGFTSAAVGITIVGAAMLIFAQAIEKLGKMDISVLGKGLLTMAEALIAIALGMDLMPAQSIMSRATGILVVAAAMLVLAQAVKKLGSMNLPQLGIALLAIGGSLAAIALATNAMGKGSLSGSASIMLVVAALALLTPILKTLGQMKVSEIAKSLITLASVFAIFGLASAVLAPMIGTMTALAGALLIFGAAILAIGVGVTALSVGLTTLAASGAAAAVGVTTIFSSLISIIPMFIEQIGYGIVAFLDVIANSATAIATTVGTLISAFTSMIIEHAPEIVDAAIVLISALLGALEDHAYDFTVSAINIINNFLLGIRDKITSVIDTAVDVIMAFIGGLISKIPDIVAAAFDIVTEFIKALGDTFHEKFPDLVEAVFDLAGDIIDGLIDGLMAGLTSIGNTIIEIGNSIVDGFKSFFHINSPSRLIKDEIGHNIIEGLADGLDEHKSVLKSVKDVGNAIINGFKDKFKMNSPSRLMRDEVGNYIVEGIAEGIDENTSAEDAAAKKAQNIVNAFKTELDKLDLDETTADLEYKLWEATAGVGASDADKEAAKLGNLASKYELQAQKVALAQAEYETTLTNLGAYAEETQQSYNKLLNSQIALAELANEINSLQSQSTETQKAAIDKYYGFLRDNTELLLNGGMTVEQIKEAAVAMSGYDPDAVTNNMSSTVTQAVGDAMGTVQKAYESTAESTLGSLVGNFEGYGESYGTAVGTGIQNRAPDASSATTVMVNSCLEVIKEQQPGWTDMASYLVDGFVIGIRENTNRAVEAAKELATMAFAAAMAQFGIASPSKKFAWMGKMNVLGLVKGINENADAAADASADMATKAMNSVAATISRISEVIDSNVDIQPTIRPVLDIDKLRQDSEEINGIISDNANLRLSGTISRVNFAARSSQRAFTTDENGNPVPQGGNTSYNFVQNNYSPKELSRQEIYRQTRNQFAALKGRAIG